MHLAPCLCVVFYINLTRSSLGRLDANGGRFRGASCHGLSLGRAQLQVEVQQNTNDVEHQLQLQHILLRAPLLAPSFSAQLEIARACAYSTAVLLLLLVLCAPFGRPGRGTQRRGRGRHERRARAFTPLIKLIRIDIFHVGAPAAQRPPAAPARRRPTACARWSVTPLRLLGGQRTSGKKKQKKESNRYSGFPGGPPP